MHKCWPQPRPQPNPGPRRWHTKPFARFVYVSELLGDADQRYFSAGYRAVRQDLRGIRLYTDDHGAIRVGASLALSYPQSWSQKAG